MTFNVWALDANQPSMEIRTIEQLTWTSRLNSVSAGWSLLTHDLDVAEALSAPNSGILIVDPSTGEKWSGHFGVITDDDGEKVTMSGQGDLGLLAGRAIHPEPLTPYNPALNGLTYSTDSHDVLTGAAVDVIADLIDRNAGQAALPGRRIPGMTITRTGVGPTITVRARWNPNLLAAIEEKATANNVAVELSSSGKGSYDCIVRQVEDKPAVFSEALQTLDAWERTTTAATATGVWGLGPGELTARIVRYAERPDLITGRHIERTMNYSSAQSVAEVDALIADELELSRAKTSMRVVIPDQPGSLYGTDYQLGDRVEIRINEQSFTEPITEVTTTITPDETEPRREVLVGFGPIDLAVKPLVEQRRLADRISRLEGS